MNIALCAEESLKKNKKQKIKLCNLINEKKNSHHWW